MGGRKRIVREHSDYVVSSPGLTIEVRYGSSAGDYGADKFRTVPPADRCVVHAQLATIRTERARSFLRRVWQVWTSYFQQQWPNARRGSEERGTREGFLRRVDVNSRRNADGCGFQPNRRKSRLGRKLRSDAEQTQSQRDRKCRGHRHYE